MDGIVRVWDTNAFSVAAEFKIADIAYSFKANSSGSMIAVGTNEYEVAMIDPSTGGFLQRLTGHKGAVTSVDWSSSCEYVLASGSLDGAVKLWDTRRGGARSLLASFDWRQEQDVRLDESRWQKDWSRDDAVRAHEGAVMCARFTACGRYLLTSGNDKRLRIWSVETANCGRLLDKNIKTNCFR